MIVLVVGLVLFLGIHSLPMFQDVRSGLQQKFGENGYKGVFSIVSAVGLGLIIYGYGLARFEGPPLVYDPPFWLRHVAMLLLVPVFILLIAAYVQSRIKRAFRHPMLTAVKLWAFSHLLANGDLASVLLFGGFLAWAVIDRISLKRRGNGDPSLSLDSGAYGGMADVIVIVGGLAVYGLFVWKLHALLIGMPLF